LAEQKKSQEKAGSEKQPAEKQQKEQQNIAGTWEHEKVSKAESEKKDLIETLQRLQAEFENYKKRAEKEKQQCVFIGKAKAVSELLPVLDSFNAAEEKLKKEKKTDSGIELLHKQFAQAMQKIGLREIKAQGEKFSHETMDCLLRGKDNTKENETVLEELQKGYVLDGIVLRHAKVKVNKTAEKEETITEKKEEGKETAGTEKVGEKEEKLAFKI